MIKIEDNKLMINLGYVKFTLYIEKYSLKLIEKEGKMSCCHRECDGEMYPHHISSIHRVLNGYAIDIAFKCYKCNCYDIHGIAIDERTYKKALNLLQRKLVFFDKKFMEIYNRLKFLGYW